MSTTVFPVDGAANAAELFALLAGHSNATDFVDDGLTISVDTTNNTASLSAGTCYIHLDTATVSGTDNQLRDLGYVVQLSEQTVSIPTSGTVTIAVVPDYSAPNAAAIEYYTTQSDVPPGALAIATVDCDDGTVTEYNRAPDIDAESLSVIGEATVGGDLTVSEDIVLDGKLKKADGTTLFGPDTSIPVSSLSDNTVTIQTDGDITGGGSVTLGDTITLSTDVAVTSVHGRTGDVSAATGDYTHAQIADVSSDNHHSYPVPNEGLVNDSVTISTGGDLTGGGSVSLGGSVNISAETSDPYTDANAISAVDGQVSTASDSVSGLDSQVSSNVSAISSLQLNKVDQSSYTPESDTHDRYTDSEAVSAVDGAISAAASSVSKLDDQVNTNRSDISSLQSDKLEQSAYTPEADTHDEFTLSDAVTAIDGEISSAASTVSALDTQVSTNTTDISALQSGKLDQSAYNPESDTHNKYTDSEAVSAINGELSAAASTISALDTAVAGKSDNSHDHTSSSESSIPDTALSENYVTEADYSRYTDSEAISAVDVEISAAANSLSGLDTEVSTNVSDISSLQSNKLDSSSYTPEADTHDKYTDSNAITAVDEQVNEAATSVAGLDTQVAENANSIPNTTITVGNSEPEYPSEGDIWIDTSGNDNLP